MVTLRRKSQALSVGQQRARIIVEVARETREPKPDWEW